MASQRRMKVLKWTVLAGASLLGACIATVPVRSGYGGSGYPDRYLEAARDQCLHVARDFRGYRGVRAGPAEVTGPNSARVELRVHGAYGGAYEIPCDYNARTGEAYVR